MAAALLASKVAKCMSSLRSPLDRPVWGPEFDSDILTFGSTITQLGGDAKLERRKVTSIVAYRALVGPASIS